ncbi:FtsX-like permease family protein [Streptomyces reniochalinae]|uniref:ABC transporter permease n=1 Tax=Streptomyces reniochalinae TaxID=2250578 RepID=A0A367EHG9_9ACTN|nr:ABC transporter permease [Streptomyces reniochalinae]RCG17491.1 ABC transporter permease [Streptomyces reniochalinae]
MFRSALRALVAHRIRFLLPGLAVVLGVAFVTGSLLYSQSAAAALDGGRGGAQADVSVRMDPGRSSGDERTRLDDALLRQLRALPGVASARGSVEGSAHLVGRDGALVGEQRPAIGVNWVPGRNGTDPRYPLTAGHGPRTGGEIAVDAGAAARAGHRVGDRVRVVVEGTARTARLVGVFASEDPRTATGGTLTAFDPRTAQHRFAAAPGTYAQIGLTAARGTSAAELAERAAAVLPADADVSTRAENDAAASALNGGDKRTTLLLGFAGVALFVSTFLIATTFTMLGAARAREHALLRAVGATRRQVTGQVLTEAFLVGTFASALGYGLGTGVAAVLNALFGVTGSGGGPAVPLRLDSVTAPLAAFGVGIGVTMVSAYLPARRAGAVPPVAALRTGGEGLGQGPLRRRGIAGTAVTAAGVVLLAIAADDPNTVFAAAPVLLLGLILLAPLLALCFTSLLRVPLRRLAGVRGTLAVENARRNPRRTAATVTTLMIGLAMVSALTMAITAVDHHDEQEAAARMTSDLRITAVDFGEIGPDTAKRVAEVTGAQAVSPLVRATLRPADGEDDLTVTGVDPGTVREVTSLTVRAGSLDRLDDGIAVTTDLARERGWRLGTRVTGTFGGSGTRTSLPVVALYDGPDTVTPALVSAHDLPEPTVAQDSPRVASVLVDAAPGRADALRTQIRETLDNPALLVQDRADVRAAASAGTAPLLTQVYALLSVTVVIGCLGVVNTMGMAVHERVREIGLLRIIGWECGRVGPLLRLEALVIALLGCLLGLGSGLAIGTAAVLGQGGLTLVVPWAQLAASVAATALIGTLASVVPARRAARIPMLRATSAE